MGSEHTQKSSGAGQIWCDESSPINDLGISYSEQARRLLSLQVQGDSKLKFLFTELFLQQLPSQVLAALANTAMTDCRALAQEADTFLLIGVQRCMAALNPSHDTCCWGTQW